MKEKQELMDNLTTPIKMIHSSSALVIWAWVDMAKDTVRFSGKAGMILGLMTIVNAVSLSSVWLGILGLIFMYVGAYVDQKNKRNG